MNVVYIKYREFILFHGSQFVSYISPRFYSYYYCWYNISIIYCIICHDSDIPKFECKILVGAGNITLDHMIVVAGNITRDHMIVGAGNITRDRMIVGAGKITRDHTIVGAGNITRDHMIVGAGNITRDHMKIIHAIVCSYLLAVYIVKCTVPSVMIPVRGPLSLCYRPIILMLVAH